MAEKATREQLKHMTKGQYRDYMAQRNRVEDIERTTNEFSNRKGGSVFKTKPSKKYYARFDRGAARYAKRKARRR